MNLRKLTVRKYDPMINQHVLFNEVRLASGKKRT
jgi:ribosomal protein L33